MTRKTKSSLPTGRGGRKALTTTRKADLKRGTDINAGNGGISGINSLRVMDTAVIAMVNLYLKSLASCERYIILKSVITSVSNSISTSDISEDTSDISTVTKGIRAHIDGAKLAKLIDEAKEHLAYLLNVNITPKYGRPNLCEEQSATTAEEVVGVEMIDTSHCGMIRIPDYEEEAEEAHGAESNLDKVNGIYGNVWRIDGTESEDDGFPKYNKELEMSFDNLINKSWELLFDLMKNLSGAEYVKHMPFEMAEMITDRYEKVRGQEIRQ